MLPNTIGANTEARIKFRNFSNSNLKHGNSLKHNLSQQAFKSQTCSVSENQKIANSQNEVSKTLLRTRSLTRGRIMSTIDHVLPPTRLESPVQTSTLNYRFTSYRDNVWYLEFDLNSTAVTNIPTTTPIFMQTTFKVSGTSQTTPAFIV